MNRNSREKFVSAVTSKPAANRVVNSIVDCFGVSSPEATGRFFLSGFVWSIFLSMCWFSTKIAAVTSEKAIDIGSTV